MKKLLLGFLLVTVFLTTSSTVLATQNPPLEELYVKAQVNDIKEQQFQVHPEDPLYDPTKGDPQYHKTQMVTYEVLESKHKGLIFESKNEITGQIFDLDLKKGDKVMLLLKILDEETVDGFATDYIRNNTMIIFIILFIAALILIGKLKGVRAIISLTITIGAIFLILIPLTIQGYDPLLMAVIISIFITIATILIIAGLNKKALSAIIGTLGGVIAAALIAYIVGNISLLSGLSGEDARILYINRPDLNFYHIFFASIIIGALGAIMDVGMSIASSVNEISDADKKASSSKLFKAGMNVGKDIMGTMSNTLILAYVGSALPLLILFSLNEFGVMHVINFDFIAAEIVRAISGSFGLLLAVPITAFTGAALARR